MAAPAVQNLSDVIASLNPVFQPQTQAVNNQIAALPGQFDAQRSALGAAKVQGFNQINDQATGKGLAFSGIPLDEQSTYLSTKYLPGLQQANQQQNDQTLQLQKELAGINSQQQSKALDIRSQQQSALDQYLAQEAQRQFEAQQAALTRAASARSQAAADAPPTLDQYVKEALAQGFTGDNRKNGWTESYLAGNVANAYNISRADALNKIYALRQAYGGK